MKSVTVLSVALSVRWATLLQAKQYPGKHVRQYVARLCCSANVCQWTKNGTYNTAIYSGNTAIDYTKDIVKLVPLNGLEEEEIRKEVLGTADIDMKTLNKIVGLIDSKETAAHAMGTENLKVSARSHKKMVQGQPRQGSSPG